MFYLPTARGLSSTVSAVSGAKAYFYDAGTINPRKTYTTAALTVEHPVPVPSNSVGVFPPIFIDPAGGDYKVDVQSAAGVSLSGYPVDNLQASQSATDLGSILFPQSEAEANEDITPAAFFRISGDNPAGLVDRYGPVGTSDDGPTINLSLRAMGDHGVVHLMDFAHNVQTPLVLTKQHTLIGCGKRVTSLIWTGGAQHMITLAQGGNDGNCYVADFTLGNTGAAISLIKNSSVRNVFERLMFIPAVAPSISYFQTDQFETVYECFLRDSDFMAQSIAAMSPTMVMLWSGHTHVIDGCLLQGATEAIVRVGGGENGGNLNQPVIGFRIGNSHIECGSGADPDRPGAAVTRGVDLVWADSPEIRCNFQMCGDGNVAGAAQRAIYGQNVNGGFAKCHIDGGGQLTAGVDIASSGVKGFDAGNCLGRSINGPVVVASGSGNLLSNYVAGNNYAAAPTTKAFDPAYTPVLTFSSANAGAYTSTGKAWREGDWVCYEGTVTLTTISPASGNPRISAPVTSTNDTGNTTLYTVYAQSMSTVTTIQCLQAANSAIVKLYDPAGTELTHANFTNSSQIIFKGRIYSRLV